MGRKPVITKQYLRRNPIGNQAFSVFSGQKPGTRIILVILQSFLHFVKTTSDWFAGWRIQTHLGSLYGRPL